MLLTEATAAQNEVALSYYRVRGLYFLADIFAVTIISALTCNAVKPPQELHLLRAGIYIRCRISAMPFMRCDPFTSVTAISKKPKLIH